MRKIIILILVLSLVVLIGCSQVSQNSKQGQEVTHDDKSSNEVSKNQEIISDKEVKIDPNACPSLNDIPLNEWNPIMVGVKWDSSTKNYNVNLDHFMDESGKMKASSESRWRKFLETQDLNGFEITQDSGLNIANPNCWAYQSKKGYNPNYNYCFVQLKKNILDSEGNVEETIKKKLVVVFDHSVLFPVNTTAVFGNDFELWTFTNLSFVKSYCE